MAGLHTLDSRGSGLGYLGSSRSRLDAENLELLKMDLKIPVALEHQFSHGFPHEDGYFWGYTFSDTPSQRDSP